MGNLLDELNEAQRQAVECTEGPVMVIAGAGSGKTRVLTYRIAYLLHLKVDPFRILALTFTNKAAREMKERINDLVGPDARSVWMGTFHSIFARVLRVEGHRFGYPSNFTIYDMDDTKRLIKTLIKENNLDDKVYQVSYLLHRISSAKTSLIDSQAYNADGEIQSYDTAAGKPLTGQIYSQYQARLYRASAMDFDDLLFNMVILFRDYPDVLYKYQQKFQYILVDEYQDTNYAQYLILKQLAANNENICVVGDDAQSIYAFRGANIQNILNFRNDYPDHHIFKLEQNYRSTKTIVAVANKIIENNKDQIFKEIWTDNEEGNKITLLRAATETEEGNLVAQSIFENRMNQQLPNTSFAILYRTNAQSRALEEALRKLNIPCRIYGGISFYQRKEIKDLLAYFRMVINPHDEEAMLRIINYPMRGIGKTTIEKLIVAAGEYKKSIFELLEDPYTYPVQIMESTRSKLSAFVLMIKSFATQLKTRDAYDLATHIAGTTGILKDLHEDKTPEGVSRYENIEELLNAIREFTENKESTVVPEIHEDTGEIVEGTATTGEDTMKTLDQFMQEVALLTDLDYSEDGDDDRVMLMTIHAAKGLEFPYVYVVGMEENLFPSVQSLNTRTELEEERRLFYVAVTRARTRLTLSYAENRYRWGNPTQCEPSRFLEEIPQSFIDMPRRPVPKKQGFNTDNNFSNILSGTAPEPKHVVIPKNLQKLSTIPVSGASSSYQEQEIQPGMEVEHDRFGKGKVLNLEGDGPNKKATVFFPGVGQKQLLLRFAKLKVL
ncbi:MAG: 3'-5' exonuclease [Bacteroidota bacterium]|nr:3'-5' exonuclease [Bacteroidota bacterium]